MENPLETSAKKAALLLKSMGHPTRLMVLCLLKQEELTVSAINGLIKIPQSSLSQHLAYLRREGLVNVRRDAQNIYYSIDNKEVIGIIDTLHKLYC